MIDFAKKFFAYVAGAITFIVGLISSKLVDIPILGVAVCIFSVAIVSGLIAWLEVFRSPAPTMSEGNSGLGQISLRRALEHAHALSVSAGRNDERVAQISNNIVRNNLDKRSVKYAEYKEWRKKNPLIFTAVLNKNTREVIGFFDIFPLTDDAATQMRSGKLAEYELTIDSILPAEKISHANTIYVASIILNPTQKSFSPLVAKDVIIDMFGRYLYNIYPPSPTRSILGFAHTKEGHKLLINYGFTNIVLKNNSVQHDPLFELSPKDYQKLYEGDLCKIATDSNIAVIP